MKEVKYQQNYVEKLFYLVKIRMHKDIQNLKDKRAIKRNEYQQGDMEIKDLKKRLKRQGSYRAGAITQIRNEEESGRKKKTRGYI